MITYSIKSTRYYPKISRFPAGEVGVRLICEHPIDARFTVYVVAKIKTSDDVMMLLNLVDAVKRKYPFAEMVLEMAYVPYARQDRICNPGESISIVVLAKLINSCGFQRVHILDPHSETTEALIERVVVVSKEMVFSNLFSRERWGKVTIVAPDAGAYKKAYQFAQAVGAKNVISCNKVRDPATGEITDYKVMRGDQPIEHAVVLDDIIDGGRTFIELSNNLRPFVGRLDLVASHAIFSKGVEIVASLYDNVYTTCSYYDKEDLPETVKNVQFKGGF